MSETPVTGSTRGNSGESHTAARRRPLVTYGGENLQEQMLRRVEAVGSGGYVAESRSEASTLANLHKRGWLDRERIAGRWCYRLRVEPLLSDAGQQELIV